MALIKCPECGKEISDKAKTCINCGCPLSEMNPSGEVRIKMPNNVVDGWSGLLSSKRAVVKKTDGTILWEGKHGENASFTIDAPANIIIELGSFANDVEGTVSPKKKYTLVQDLGIHMRATFRLSEVDVIDS